MDGWRYIYIYMYMYMYMYVCVYVLLNSCACINATNPFLSDLRGLVFKGNPLTSRRPYNTILANRFFASIHTLSARVLCMSSYMFYWNAL